jgi:hypothetical protein
MAKHPHANGDERKTGKHDTRSPFLVRLVCPETAGRNDDDGKDREEQPSGRTPESRV